MKHIKLYLKNFSIYQRRNLLRKASVDLQDPIAIYITILIMIYYQYFILYILLKHWLRHFLKNKHLPKILIKMRFCFYRKVDGFYFKALHILRKYNFWAKSQPFYWIFTYSKIVPKVKFWSQSQPFSILTGLYILKSFMFINWVGMKY
ncbi:hypothetical protein ACJX0J_005828 [Zea mays]